MDSQIRVNDKMAALSLFFDDEQSTVPIAVDVRASQHGEFAVLSSREHNFSVPKANKRA